VSFNANYLTSKKDNLNKASRNLSNTDKVDITVTWRQKSDIVIKNDKLAFQHFKTKLAVCMSSIM